MGLIGVNSNIYKFKTKEKENDDKNKDQIQKEKNEKKNEQDSSIQRQEEEKDVNMMNNNQMDIVIEPIPKEPTKKDDEEQNDGRHPNTKQQQNDVIYKKSKTTLQKMTGTIEYVTDPSFQGHLQICVIHHGTNNKQQQQQQQPAFLSLRIKLSASSSLVSKDGKKKRYKTTHLTIGLDEAKQQVLEQSIDYLTDEIQALTNGLVELHHTADGIEFIESDLYSLATDMNSAASWWPVIRLIILIITGITQVRTYNTYIHTL